jgi:hypothetical protein
MQKYIKEFDRKYFSKATKIFEQKVLKNTSATLVIFLYLKIFLEAFSLLYFDALEHRMYAAVHCNEGFHLVLK